MVNTPSPAQDPPPNVRAVTADYEKSMRERPGFSMSAGESETRSHGPRSRASGLQAPCRGAALIDDQEARSSLRALLLAAFLPGTTTGGTAQ